MAKKPAATTGIPKAILMTDDIYKRHLIHGAIAIVDFVRENVSAATFKKTSMRGNTYVLNLQGYPLEHETKQALIAAFEDKPWLSIKFANQELFEIAEESIIDLTTPEKTTSFDIAKKEPRNMETKTAPIKDLHFQTPHSSETSEKKMAIATLSKKEHTPAPLLMKQELRCSFNNIENDVKHLKSLFEDMFFEDSGTLTETEQKAELLVMTLDSMREFLPAKVLAALNDVKDSIEDVKNGNIEKGCSLKASLPFACSESPFTTPKQGAKDNDGKSLTPNALKGSPNELEKSGESSHNLAFIAEDAASHHEDNGLGDEESLLSENVEEDFKETQDWF